MGNIPKRKLYKRFWRRSSALYIIALQKKQKKKQCKKGLVFSSLLPVNGAQGRYSIITAMPVPMKHNLVASIAALKQIANCSFIAYRQHANAIFNCHASRTSVTKSTARSPHHSPVASLHSAMIKGSKNMYGIKWA